MDRGYNVVIDVGYFYCSYYNNAVSLINLCSRYRHQRKSKTILPTRAQRSIIGLSARHPDLKTPILSTILVILIVVRMHAMITVIIPHCLLGEPRLVMAIGQLIFKAKKIRFNQAGIISIPAFS